MRLAARAQRHASQRLDIRAIEDERARCQRKLDGVEAERRRQVVTVDKLPRRGSRSSAARAVVLEVRSGHEDAAAVLTRHVVKVARLSGFLACDHMWIASYALDSRGRHRPARRCNRCESVERMSENEFYAHYGREFAARISGRTA